MTARCLERRKLGNDVGKTLDLMYTAEREFEKAKSSPFQDDTKIFRLASELSDTRSAARDAQRKLDAHVREHQCKE
jgi:hypothetical protein